MPDEIVTSEGIIAEARGWLGVPWGHQGSTRCGVDCVGLVVCLADVLDQSAHDSISYPRR
ncbi:hypothetical protein L2D01_03620 [Hyphomonadaceae bacterium ML37]|jgi:hypothetical protein|nr:hypothetical protein L2D01_03620 [Hyphomonadaceae bacterium ML37]